MDQAKQLFSEEKRMSAWIVFILKSQKAAFPQVFSELAEEWLHPQQRWPHGAGREVTSASGGQ